MKTLMAWLLTGLASASAASPMTVYVVDGMTRVRLDDARGSTQVVGLKAARNEYEPLQIVVHAGNEELKGVNVELSDLRGERRQLIELRNITLYRAHYIHVVKPSPKTKEYAAWYPDALIPFVNPTDGKPLGKARFCGAPFDVAPNRNQPVWVDVYVPADVLPGELSGTVTVTAENQKPVKIPLTLTVWDFKLPDAPSMRANFGGFGGRIAKAHQVQDDSPELRVIERRYAEMMAAHRICPLIPHYLYPKVNADGGIDATAAHAALKEWMERLHISGFPIELIGGDPLGKDRERNVKYLRAMWRYLKGNGWEKLAYIYVLDEPNDAKAYEEVRQRAKLIHDAQPGIKVLCTEQAKPQDPAWGTLVGSVDLWVPLWCLYDENIDAERLKAGDEYWSYTALCQGEKGKDTPYWEMDFPVLNYRIPLWMSWRYGMTGLLYWTTVYWEKTKDVWTIPLTYEDYNGEGSLFYPGTDAGFDGPVASTRLKMIREGMEDYEYMKLLANLDDKEFANEISRHLARSWTDWDDKPASLYAAREELAKRIIARIHK